MGHLRFAAKPSRFAAYLPLLALPPVSMMLAVQLPAWVFMWTLAGSIYVGLKWLTFADSIGKAKTTFGRSVGYLLLWPGMDAKPFFKALPLAESPSPREWLGAIAKLFGGLVLIAVAVELGNYPPMLAGWIGMWGVVLALHFGLFHVLSLTWRRMGVDACPIMNAPLHASSLNEFWSRRWNLAFRDLAHTYLFRPLVGRVGIVAATMAVFVVSGIIHDAVISIPAGAGYGLPTLYFVIQGVGVLFERSRMGRAIGLRNVVIGRVFCVSVTLGPVGLLFPPPFIERVMVPMLVAFGRS